MQSVGGNYEYLIGKCILTDRFKGKVIFYVLSIFIFYAKDWVDFENKVEL